MKRKSHRKTRFHLSIGMMCFEILFIVLNESQGDLKGARPREQIVFCVLFCKKLLYLDWKHIKMTCWNRISFAVPFPSFCSARKTSHGTSSPHWAPAHAGRIMDGDWNTYKAEYTAAPWTELPYVYPVSPPVLCVKTTKIKATANSLRALWAQMDFICVLQTSCWRSADRIRVTSISANDDKRVGWWNFTTVLLRHENTRGVYLQCLLPDWRGNGDYKWIYSTYCGQARLKTSPWKGRHVPGL